MLDWILDDITFCGSECELTECFRHPANIRLKNIPHSFAAYKGTDFARDTELPCAVGELVVDREKKDD